MADKADEQRTRKGNELQPEEQTRLMTHGLHEETVFYNRLNFFMVCESLLFAAAVSAMSGNNRSAFLIVLPICILGFVVSALWLYLQLDKLALLQTLEDRGAEAFKEFRESVKLADKRRSWLPQVRSSSVLAWTFPLLFMFAWIYLGILSQIIRC